MNKKELVQASAQTEEDRLLLAQVLDRLEACRSRSYLTRTRFLDLRQRTLVDRLIERAGARGEAVLWGGYPEAERVCALFYPDYLDAEGARASAPLALLRAEKHPADVLTHRDYLGSLMGLGLERAMIGDILVHDAGADIIVLEESADYILTSWERAGRKRLQLSQVPFEALIVPVPEERFGEGTVASLRLDAVTALIFGIPRSKAQEAIEKGLVFVNQLQAVKNELPLDEGDRITLRGTGRARIDALGGVSRKGRQFVRYARSV